VPSDAQRRANLKYYYAHRDEYNARSRARYRDNPELREKRNAWKRAWDKANRHVRRTSERNRRAKKRLAEGTHTAAETAAIRRSQKNRCVYCRVKLGRHGHLDHIIPLSRGGSNERRNLQWLCAECNIRKGAKDPIEFARANGMLI